MALLNLNAKQPTAAPADTATTANTADCGYAAELTVLHKEVQNNLAASRKEENEEETLIQRGIVKFTEKEIKLMPKWMRKQLNINGRIVHARKRIRGRNSCTIELRYRRDGYNVSVSATDLETAKERFIAKVREIERINPYGIKVPFRFQEFTMFYFEHFRKKRVGEKTYKNDLSRLRKYVFPVLGDMKIRAITPIVCNQVIEDIPKNSGGVKFKGNATKTAQEIKSLMKVIFEAAIQHGLIDRNPVVMVYIESEEAEHGTILSRNEELRLLDHFAGTPYRVMFAVALYTGMRPCEYHTARIEGKFIIAQTMKRHNKKTEYKKIPITPMLRPFLEGVTELHFASRYMMNEKFREVFPNKEAHRLYDLRTTFYTRCRMCGVTDLARDAFVGHTGGVLSRSYTDLPDEYLLSEGEKIKY